MSLAGLARSLTVALGQRISHMTHMDAISTHIIKRALCKDAVHMCLAAKFNMSIARTVFSQLNVSFVGDNKRTRMTVAYVAFTLLYNVGLCDVMSHNDRPCHTHDSRFNHKRIIICESASEIWPRVVCRFVIFFGKCVARDRRAVSNDAFMRLV